MGHDIFIDYASDQLCGMSYPTYFNACLCDMIQWNVVKNSFISSLQEHVSSPKQKKTNWKHVFPALRKGFKPEILTIHFQSKHSSHITNATRFKSPFILHETSFSSTRQSHGPSVGLRWEDPHT